MTKNPILLNKMMEDLTQALAPEKVQAIHEKLDHLHAKIDAIIAHAHIPFPPEPDEDTSGDDVPEMPPDSAALAEASGEVVNTTAAPGADDPKADPPKASRKKG
jgi:2',3'-cyclic-nucleotide 2'-phosphodiesterase (5'-nucleotidase family)